MLSLFYTKQEIAMRIAILYTANICGTAFAGLIAIAIFKMGGVAGLSGWRWLFIIQGIATFVLAIASAFVLPDEPLHTRWLSEDERKLAHQRIEAETVLLKPNTTTWVAIKEACTDVHFWILVPMYHFHMAASGFKNFFPTVSLSRDHFPQIFDRRADVSTTCLGRWYFGLRADNNSGPGLSPLPRIGRDLHRLGPQFWPLQRAHLAYHHRQGGWRPGLRTRL